MGAKWAAQPSTCWSAVRFGWHSVQQIKRRESLPLGSVATVSHPTTSGGPAQNITRAIDAINRTTEVCIPHTPIFNRYEVKRWDAEGVAKPQGGAVTLPHSEGLLVIVLKDGVARDLLSSHPYHLHHVVEIDSQGQPRHSWLAKNTNHAQRCSRIP